MLDLEYVKDAAGGIAHYLRRHGQVCELAYTPGNGSLYELVVIPADALGDASGWMDHPKARSIRADRQELSPSSSRSDAWILLAWVGHGCWPVDLAAVWSRGYIAEKFDCSIADGDAIRSLLLEVSGQLGMSRLQVAS